MEEGEGAWFRGYCVRTYVRTSEISRDPRTKRLLSAVARRAAPCIDIPLNSGIGNGRVYAGRATRVVRCALFRILRSCVRTYP